MKKSVLTLSIAAAVVTLGFAGGAQAMSGALTGATAGSDLALNQDGVGHMLLVPYFTAQAENATLINLVNTDTINGKAVKVRFRGAANSDDIFDFQVFLSPGDVWSANVGKGSDGRAQLTTNDASCTKPAKATLNATPFVTARLDSTLDAAGRANGTREGYVEIFNMGDIPKAKSGGTAIAHPYQPAGTNLAGPDSIGADGTTATPDGVNDLFWAIKHKAKVAPCSGNAWTALDSTDLADTAAAKAAGLLPPSTGLMGSWTIINVVGAASWSGAATAIQAVATGVPALGNVVYWPQTGTAVTSPNNYTADPLLRSADVYYWNTTGAGVYTADVTPAVVAGFYDLPDMSTPYTTTAVTPANQALSLTKSIAASKATNEFVTDSSIIGSTDWVFSQPTRRYSMALDYATKATGDDGRRFSDLFATAGAFTTAYYNAAKSLVTARQICVTGPTVSVWDREETTLTATTDVVVSPSTPSDPLSFCGETSVLSINNGARATTAALKANVSVKDLDVTYVDGWMTLTTPSATAVPAGVAGLPVLGSAFVKASAGANSFGAAFPHRFAR